MDSDIQALLPEETTARWCVRHRKKLCILLTVALIIIGIGVAVFFAYFKCTYLNCVGIKVIALNTWGMPKLFGSEYKTERMNAIADRVAKADYDVFLLEELWMQPDHEVIASRIPKGYQMTGFRQLALADCDGRVAPTSCSGLAIVSRFPFKEIEFNSYTWHGDPMKMLIDGEYLAKKGVGRVQILPEPNLKVDIFVTHTAADPDPSHGYNNSYYRVKQVRELMDTYILHSKADVILLGGDFNAEPVEKPGSPYHMVRQHMENCVEDIFYKLQEWLNIKFATYGNKANTFSGGKYSPVTYDYIFHRTNNKNRTLAWTNWFELPLLKLKIMDDIVGFGGDNRTKRDVAENEVVAKGKREREISFSDHEAVESTIYMWK